MKKLAAIFTALILLIGLFAVPVTAAGNGTIAMSGTSGKQGDTVSIDVRLNENPGLITMKFTIAYGSNLQLVSVTNAELLKGWTAPSPTVQSPYTIRWADSLASANNTATGKILTLKFKISDTATPGNETVTLTFTESRDKDGAKLSFNNTTAQIAVSCKTHSFDGWQKNDASTHKHVCSVCSTVETAPHTWNSGTVTKAATCKETGIKTYTCTACGQTKTETIAKLTTHTFGAWKITKAATCDTAGEQTRTCSVCGKTETQVIKALGHSFGTSTITKKPTCTETGIESGKCTRCEKTATNTIPALGHKFESWTVDKAPTCTEAGVEKHECSVCKTVETRPIDALGHSFSESVTVKEPTISEKGISEGTCTRCGQKTQQDIPCMTIDEKTGIKFEAEEGTFAKGTTVIVKQIAENEPTYASAKAALADESGKIVLFDISAVLGDTKVQPNGTVNVTFKMPEGFSNNAVLYFIADDGTKELIASTVSNDGTTITAALTHFSVYAIFEATQQTPTPTAVATAPPADPQNNRSLTPFLIIGASVIAIGIISAVVIIKKKRISSERP